MWGGVQGREGRCAGQREEGNEASTGQKGDLKLEEREVPFLGLLHPASPLLPLLVLALISLLLSHHLYLLLTHLFVQMFNKNQIGLQKSSYCSTIIQHLLYCM